MEWFSKFIEKYANFKGRISRIEFWKYMIRNFIKTIILIIIYELSKWFNLNIPSLVLSAYIEIPFRILIYGYGLLIFISQLALMVRRLHDTGKSAWWLLFLFLAGVGFIFLLFFLSMKGVDYANEYGENPQLENYQANM